MESPTLQREQRERIVLITQLMASYPPRPDPKATLLAILQDTADIPVPWLREGVRTFKNEADREWLPSVPEIRTAVARAVAKAGRHAKGKPTDDYSPVTAKAIDVDRVLEYARTKVPLGHAQMWELHSGQRKRELAARGHPDRTMGEERTIMGQKMVAPGASGPRFGVRTVAETVATVLPPPGEPNDAKRANDIWRSGDEVPGKDHPTISHSLQGVQLAHLLIRRLRGEVPPRPNEVDFARLDAAMTRHMAEARERGRSVTWWDDLKRVWGEN